MHELALLGLTLLIGTSCQGETQDTRKHKVSQGYVDYWSKKFRLSPTFIWAKPGDILMMDGVEQIISFRFGIAYSFLAPLTAMAPLAISPDNKMLATPGWSDISSWKVHRYPRFEELIEKYSKYDGHHFIAIEDIIKEKLIHIIDASIEEGNHKENYKCRIRDVPHLEFSIDGEYLYYGWNYSFYQEPMAGIDQFNMKTKEIRTIYHLTGRYIANFRVSPNQDIIWIRESTKTGSEHFLYYIKDKRKVTLGDSTVINALETDFTVDGRYIVIAQTKRAGRVALIDTQNVTKIKELPVYDTGCGLSISPDGRWLTAYYDKSLYLYSFKTGEKIYVLTTKARGGRYLWHPTWSHDSRFFAGIICTIGIGPSNDFVIVNPVKREIYFKWGHDYKSHISLITEKKVIEEIHKRKAKERKRE